LPKRLRYFLHHEPALIGPVLRIFLEALEDRLKARSPGAPTDARFGAVNFFHRFGSALNDLHFHCAIIDGVFSAQDEGVQFHEARRLSDEDTAVVQREVGKPGPGIGPLLGAPRMQRVCCGSSRGAGSIMHSSSV